MKKILFLFLIAATIISCDSKQFFPSNTVTSVTRQKEQQQDAETVDILVIKDMSASYYEHYPLSPELLKPLANKICKKYTLDLRVGFVQDNDVVFDRYYAPYLPKPDENANPWLGTEQVDTVTTSAAGWTSFAESVNAKLSQPPAKTSNIALAVNHALICLQEQPAARRKILILITDYKNTSSEQIPMIPKGIETYSVGVLPGTPIGQILGTDVHVYENLTSLLQHLETTF